MNYLSASLFLSVTALVFVTPAFATPTQTGPTGLISVPTAETLDMGNVAVGVWGNLAKSKTDKAFVVPAVITLGIGSFWEVYGTYPNLLFNGEEDSSDRNTADVGTKIRFYGTRSSNFKAAADIMLQRRISENLSRDGSTDYGGRLFVTYKTENYGIHAYSGYMSRKLIDDEILFGGGLELAVTPRSRVTAELFGSRYRKSLQDDGPMEANLGVQYHLSPYLTFSLAGGAGLSDLSPDWRFIFGISTASGLGAYIKPVPKLASEIRAEEEAAKKADIKPVKIIPISPKLVKAPAPAEPVSKIEVPLDADREEVVIHTYGQIILPPQVSQSRPVVPLPGKPDTASGNGIATAENPPTYGFDLKGEMRESAASTPPPIEEKLVAYRKFRFPDVVGYFQQGRSELTVEAKRLLAGVADQIRSDKTWAYLRIDGYTDGVGSQKYNADLSLRRAIEVASYLITREGVDPGRIFVRGMGNSKQVADNATEPGRKMNRRFEILFIKRGDKE